MAYFRPKGRVNQEQAAGTISVIIANSQTIKLGDTVKMTSGFAVPGTAGAKLLGVCVGITDVAGRPLDTTFAKTSFTGTFTGGPYGTQSYAASSTNQTGDKVKVQVIFDKQTLFVNDTAATLTTAMLFGFFNLTSSTQIAAFAPGEVAGQFQLVALDPDNDGSTTKGAFIISESQTDAYNQS